MQRTYPEKENSTSIGKFFAAIVFISVISQMPFFVARGLPSTIAMAVWGAAFLVCMGKSPLSTRRIDAPVSMALFFFAYFGLMCLVNDRYPLSSIPRAVAIAILVYVIGKMAGPLLTKEDFALLISSYIIASVLLAAAVYFDFFRGADFSSRIYLYDEKNSTGLILVTAITLILTTKLGNHNSLFKNVLLVISILILFYTAFVMKSRAVYVSMAVALLVFVFSSGMNRRAKTLIMLAVIGATVYFLLNENVMYRLMDTFVYAGRDANDLNDISSGRVNEWLSFWDDMGGNFLFGQGRMKRETLVLTVLLEFGIPVGLLLIALAIYPVRYIMRQVPRKTPLFVLSFSIAGMYVANMFFEQLAPFGPGVKCFFLWFLLGLFASGNDCVFEDLMQ